MSALALLADGPREHVRDESCYRFSVRCDRERNAAIAKAAAKLGLTPTTFVQRHFDRILDSDLPPPAKAEPVGQMELQGFARRHNLRVGHARVWFLLKREADRDGVARVAIPDIGESCFLTPDTARTYLSDLSVRGLVERVEGPGKACFRVIEGER